MKKPRTLEDLRAEIDVVDRGIVLLLAKRFEIVKQIGEFKKKNHQVVVDNSRFQKVLKKVEELANQTGIDKEFIDKIYKEIHDYACELEGKVN